MQSALQPADNSQDGNRAQMLVYQNSTLCAQLEVQRKQVLPGIHAAGLTGVSCLRMPGCSWPASLAWQYVCGRPAGSSGSFVGVLVQAEYVHSSSLSLTGRIVCCFQQARARLSTALQLAC